MEERNMSSPLLVDKLMELYLLEQKLFNEYIKNITPLFIGPKKRNKEQFNWNMKNTTTNKTTTISRTTAVNLINASKGRRFTVTYTKNDGTTRTINGSRKNQTPLGNIRMKAIQSQKSIGYRTVNPNTITELRINGMVYRVR
jgi:hypothetical protein